MDYIKFKGLPDEEAERAYQQGFYIESIQILQGWLENQARSYLMLVGCVHFKSNQENTWDLTDTVSLNDTLKVLRILNQLSTEEFASFKKFNALRNKLVHEYCKSPYEKEYLGVSKKEFDEVYQATLKHAYFFTQKCEILIG